MRYPSCLSVAPSAMDATVGGSGGIPLDPSLWTGRKYIWYEEMAGWNIIVLGQERVWNYTWVKEEHPWDSPKDGDWRGQMKTKIQFDIQDKVETRASSNGIKRGNDKAS